MFLREGPSFSGPVRAVILDWAGTAVDCGSRAPTGVFIEVFARRGVTLSPAQARGPMGMHKRKHLELLCELPDVQSAWLKAQGKSLAVADIDALYAELTLAQIAVIERYAAPIPGVLDAVAALRARGVKIGSTSGYIPEMMAVLTPAAAARGYVPDCAVSAGEVPEGRPAPFMNWEAAKRLNAWPAQAIVAVGDTPTDVEAALNAGMWAVGVVLTGNEAGLSAPELVALSQPQRDTLREHAATRLIAAGAHALIDSVAELPQLILEIERKVRT